MKQYDHTPINIKTIQIIVVIVAILTGLFIVSKAFEDGPEIHIADLHQKHASGRHGVSTGYRSITLLDDPKNSVTISTENLDSKAMNNLLNEGRNGIFTTPINISTTNQLQGRVQLKREYANPLPDEVIPSFIYYDKKLEAWLPAKSVLSNDRKTLVAEVNHLSLWSDIITGSKESLDATEKIIKRSGQIVKAAGNQISSDGTYLYETGYRLISAVVESTTKDPKCTNTIPSWAEVEGVKNKNMHDIVLWCIGSDQTEPSILEVKIGNNTNIPLRLKSNTTPDKLSSEPIDGTSTELLRNQIHRILPDATSSKYALNNGILFTPHETKILNFNDANENLEAIKIKIEASAAHEALIIVIFDEIYSRILNKVDIINNVVKPIECLKNSSNVVDIESSISATKSCLGIVLKNIGSSKSGSKEMKIAKRIEELNKAASVVAISWRVLQYVYATTADSKHKEIIIKKKQKGTNASKVTSLEYTEIKYFRAVNRAGEVQPGFKVDSEKYHDSFSRTCGTGKVSEEKDILECGISADQLPVCYPNGNRENKTAYCASDPEEKIIYEIPIDENIQRYDPELPVQPWKLVLENGTKCTIRTGGAWGSASDGRIGTYLCDSNNEVILSFPGDPFKHGIDQNDKVWFAQLGSIGLPNSDLSPPHFVGIKTAYFAATAER